MIGRHPHSPVLRLIGGALFLGGIVVHLWAGSMIGLGVAALIAVFAGHAVVVAAGRRWILRRHNRTPVGGPDRS